MDFSRMFLKLPLYVGQFVRTRYMDPADRLKPIVLPWQTHPAGRIIYTSLVCNAEMRKLSPICYSAQMFGIDEADIPEELADRYPTRENRPNFFAFALPKPHYYMGRYIEQDDMMQLRADDAYAVSTLLSNELWSAVDEYWEDYQRQFRLTYADGQPAYYYMLLDFCEFYHIDIDATDAMYRSLKRRNKRLRDVACPHNDPNNNPNMQDE